MKNRKFLLILIIIGLKTIIGLYIAGNVGQKIGLNLNNKKKRR